jgi:hypothetical protein
MGSDPFPSEVSYGMAKGIAEILYAFPSLHSQALQFLKILFYFVMGYDMHLSYFFS